jgi:hypothetical protein
MEPVTSDVDGKSEGTGFGPGPTADTIAGLQDLDAKTKVHGTARSTQAGGPCPHYNQIDVAAISHENCS